MGNYFAFYKHFMTFYEMELFKGWKLQKLGRTFFFWATEVIFLNGFFFQYFLTC